MLVFSLVTVWKGGIRTKKMYFKIIAASFVMFMICTGSVGDVPEAMEITMTLENAPKAIPSTIVWEDDFNDEDISDWNIYEINWTLPDGVANFTVDPLDLVNVSDGVLRMIGPEMTFASFNSSVAYGSWTFDVDLQHPEDFNRFGVSFIAEKFGEHWLPADGSSNSYFLSFWFDTYEIRFARNTYPGTTNFLDSYYLSDFTGWKSFIVTREPSGQFYVYLNGVLILDVLDNTHTTSERFTFFGMANPAIDNVTVHDNIIIDGAPPKWVEPPSNQMIDTGTDFSYDLNATDYSGIDQWWINDTVNFEIDDDGVISNIDVLEAGSYVLQVSVNDTLGNTQTGSFRLTVRDLEVPIPIEPIIGAVGAVLVVIIVLVLWRRKS